MKKEMTCMDNKKQSQGVKGWTAESKISARTSL